MLKFLDDKKNPLLRTNKGQREVKIFYKAKDRIASRTRSSVSASCFDATTTACSESFSLETACNISFPPLFCSAMASFISSYSLFHNSNSQSICMVTVYFLLMMWTIRGNILSSKVVLRFF